MLSGCVRSSCAPPALAVDVNVRFVKLTLLFTGPCSMIFPLKSLNHVALSTNCMRICRSFEFASDLNETLKGVSPRYRGFVDQVGPRVTVSAWSMYLATRTSVWTPVPMMFIQSGETVSAANASLRGLSKVPPGTSWVHIVNCLWPSVVSVIPCIPCDSSSTSGGNTAGGVNMFPTSG